MASASFGDPQYAQDPAAATPDANPLQPVDQNDPSLISEQVDVDASQDAYAIPPPPPDGKWRAKLKQVDVKDPADGQLKRHIAFKHEKMNDGKPFFVVNAEASLIDVAGKFDGITITEYWVKSNVDRRKNIDQMSTITKAAGGQVVTRGSHADRLNMLEKTLAGEPEVVLDTFWSAECQSCQERAKKAGERQPRPFLQGMNRFPQPKPGAFDPMVQCPTCKAMCRAQLRIGQFLSVKEAKATRGIA